MSLHTAAKYLQSHGRGPDDQLVHMSSNEVKSLQAIAKAHGGSLSINPKTGLAEAGFLDSILPVVAGAALTATGVGAPLAALMVGGGYGLMTGDINKGLMAGLGAYGGAGIGEGLMAAGATAAPTAAAGTSAATTAGAEAAATNGLSAMPQGVSQAANIAPTANTAATAAGGTQGAGSGFMDKLKTMGQGITNLGDEQARKAAYAKMPMGTLPALGLTGVNAYQQATAPEVPGQKKYSGPLTGYQLSPDFEAYVAPTPNPYYRPTGLGYAAGGDIMMAAGGSYDDEPRGDDQGFGYAAGGGIKKPAKAKVTGQAQIAKMDPYDAAVAELNNARYNANMSGAQTPKSGISGLGELPYAMGGSIGGYSDGGRMLKGPGDGMSDSIPATIGSKQPARLADGEFVVPADVVSHLGNGSTDAGARKLYGMMDKIRTARTGKKKQAPAVKADKYMPA